MGKFKFPLYKPSRSLIVITPTQQFDQKKKLTLVMAGLRSLLVCIVVVAATIVIPTSAQLSASFYNRVCPQALPAIRRVVKQAIFREPRIGASLLRLHFHDCFVNVIKLLVDCTHALHLQYMYIKM